MASLPALDLPYGDPSTWGTPQSGRVYLGINLSGILTIVQHDGTISPISTVPSVSTATNVSGDTTLSDLAGIENQTINFTGAGRTSNVILGIDGVAEGSQLNLTITLPGNPNFIIPIRNGTAGGSVLATLQNPGDPSIVSGAFTFVFDSGAWSITRAQVPAY